jgi:hypothetical protein
VASGTKAPSQLPPLLLTSLTLSLRLGSPTPPSLLDTAGRIPPSPPHLPSFTFVPFAPLVPSRRASINNMHSATSFAVLALLSSSTLVVAHGGKPAVGRHRRHHFEARDKVFSASSSFSPSSRRLLSSAYPSAYPSSLSASHQIKAGAPSRTDAAATHGSTSAHHSATTTSSAPTTSSTSSHKLLSMMKGTSFFEGFDFFTGSSTSLSPRPSSPSSLSPTKLTLSSLPLIHRLRSDLRNSRLRRRRHRLVERLRLRHRRRRYDLHVAGPRVVARQRRVPGLGEVAERGDVR